ncbi:MAG TPA: AraC family transcriptional regulator [Vicinamibacterales bacterium]|nr:AraC family transcriptional regulator [Vicinamibacterales bacterium]
MPRQLNLRVREGSDGELMDDTSHSGRAVQIFSFDEGRSSSPIAEKLWRTRSEPVDFFTSVAQTHWEMIMTRVKGRTSLTVRGPETRAKTVPIPEDAEFLGIEFRLGTFMPDLPVDRLVDSSLTLPGARTRGFWLNGSVWEFPTFDNVDVFVRRLMREGRVVREAAVDAALQGQHSAMSLRSVQRRIRRTTGLTFGLIKQIERAQHALTLLEGGASVLDVVERAGYADQPHLTRSMRRFIGHTPARILRDHSE